jgi:UDP-N-acetylglucosamine 2-epimerase (non-hydrolysing)
MRQKLLFVFGTRPEAIKMAPLVKLFQQNSEKYETLVCVTGQHREMLDQILTFFEIKPDYDLNLMKKNQNLNDLTAEIIVSIRSVLDKVLPKYVFVHGDTTTSMCTALASYYSSIKVCHVEAGLRTNNIYSPFPEEINRQITGRIAYLHFTPTELSKQNLIKENIVEDKIFITSNTVIDALLWAKNKLDTYQDAEIINLNKIVDKSKKIILVTGHRRENFGDGFLDLCNALLKIAERDDVQIIYPVHLNPNVQNPVYNLLSKNSNIKLIDPLGYPAFVWLMIESYMILTDSGGVQEEAPSLGKPVLVMRETTERPEAVIAGTVKLVGTNINNIIDNTFDLLDNDESYKIMGKIHNPYGDGNASVQILNIILNEK